MKQRLAAVDGALNGIRAQLDEEGINYRMQAKQLYCDHEEVTVFLVRTKGKAESTKAIGNKVGIVTLDGTNAKG